MRNNILFQGKDQETNEWIQGSFVQIGHDKPSSYIVPTSTELEPYQEVLSFLVQVHPGSVCEYTGMNEFVVSDRSFNSPLFEGDIVEVWSRRRPLNENIISFQSKPTSQYDVDLKVRAVIKFYDGQWRLDYNNNFNHQLEKLKGAETSTRTVRGGNELFRYGFHVAEREGWYRSHNCNFKYRDIVKLGNIFDNASLLL